MFREGLFCIGFGKSLFLSLFASVLLSACISTKSGKTKREIRQGLRSTLLENQFTGFFLMDAQTGDTLYNQNGQKYFTPASNTKIFTLFTSLSLLPERIPAFKYLVKHDTLFLEGTGDPTLLHPYFQDSTAINFLRGYPAITLNTANFQADKFGSGWAWDDFPYYYQVERNGFPLFGNVTTIHHLDSLRVSPSLFREKVVDLDHTPGREAEKNIFYYASSRTDTTEIPFRVDSVLTRKLLEMALDKKVTVTDRMPPGKKNVVYSVPSDSFI